MLVPRFGCETVQYALNTQGGIVELTHQRQNPILL